MMDIRQQHNVFGETDELATLPNGTTVWLNQYRRELQESSNKSQLQPLQSPSPSSSQALFFTSKKWIIVGFC